MNYRQPYPQYGFTRISPPYPGSVHNQRYQQPVGVPAPQYSAPSSYQHSPNSFLSDDDVFPDANVDTETTLNLLDQEFLKFQNFSPVQIFQTLFAYFFIFGTSKVFKSTIKPYKRGFFCNDNSISYPYHSSTVSAALVYFSGYLCNMSAILLVEWILVFVYWRAPRGSKCSRKLLYKISYFFYSIVAASLPFLFGGITSMAITDVGKFTIGRLRPHFLSVCQPNWKTLNCSAGYITQDVCTGDPIAVREARLSFPSGHSSLAFYCACFLVFYLHKRGFVIRTLRIIIPAISLVAIMLALFTGLSRVSDNKHHPTDVLAGSLIGAMSAAYACYLVPTFQQIKKTKIFDGSFDPTSLKGACKKCNCSDSDSE